MTRNVMSVYLGEQRLHFEKGVLKPKPVEGGFVNLFWTFFWYLVIAVLTDPGTPHAEQTKPVATSKAHAKLADHLAPVKKPVKRGRTCSVAKDMDDTGRNAGYPQTPRRRSSR